MEKSAKKKIQLEVDLDDAFDYNSGISKKYSTKDYLNLIQNEVLEVH